MVCAGRLDILLTQKKERNPFFLIYIRIRCNVKHILKWEIYLHEERENKAKDQEARE